MQVHISAEEIHETFGVWRDVSHPMFSPILRPSPMPFEADLEQKEETITFPYVLIETLRGGEHSHSENWEAAFKSKDEFIERLADAGLPANIAEERSIKNVPIKDRRHLAILGMKLKPERSYRYTT